MAEAVPTPIEDQIGDAIIARLKLVKPANGYTGNFKVIEIAEEMDVTVNDGDCILQPLNADRPAGDQQLISPSVPTMQWLALFKVRIFAKVSSNRDTPLRRVLSRFAADAIKAVMKKSTGDDGYGFLDLNGKGMHTVPLRKEYHLEVKPSYVDVFLEVHHAHVTDNPYAVNG